MTKSKTLTQILGKCILATSLALSPLAIGCGCDNTPSSSEIEETQSQQSSYSNQVVNADNNVEHRFYKDNHHFLSLIKTSQGAISIRPHPGEDVNGWGSSLYPQPFFPGATLKHTSIEGIINEDNGISFAAVGKVSKGSSSTYGDWDLDLNFSYDSTGKKINGSGTYSINLDGPIDNSTGDLNLLKIASNYLRGVPLLSGTTGDTGDMSYTDVSGDGFTFRWIPHEEPGHFPRDKPTANISMNVAGDYYDVDSVAQGHARIELAQKPSMTVTLNSQDPNAKMIFGGIYDLSKSQDFWEDNVGITPLILKPSTRTSYSYNMGFESTP